MIDYDVPPSAEVMAEIRARYEERRRRRERTAWRRVFAYRSTGRYLSGRRVWVNVRLGRWYVFGEVACWALALGDVRRAPRGYRWQRRPGS